MPGYDIVGPDEGGGLLPWSWAEERLAASHDYWVASVWPDGRPHVMPVWGVWHDRSVWFSSSGGSRKARNLRADPRCVVTTEDASEPVVVEAVAELVADVDGLTVFLDQVNAKYETSYTLDFFDPAVNACFRAHPSWVFGLRQEDFSGSPTRWSLES
jgi:PPOX class probable F420-dependent enzyme